LHALVRCCLAADPRDRPDSAAALKQRLLPLLKREVPTTV
jgi:hypothetical protein